MNVVILKGNLTSDPNVRQITSNGRETSVANFTVAVNRHFKRSDGTADKQVTFVDCEAWDTGAKNIGEYVKKGDPILIRGSLKLDQWEKEGQKRSTLKVRVGSFERLFRSSQSGDNVSNTTNETVNSSGGDDIPF